MKVRILEQKNAGPYRPTFHPQYKNWPFWEDILKDERFMGSLYNKSDYEAHDDVYHLFQAEKVLNDFIEYSKKNGDSSSYTKVHNQQTIHL